jgi:hypothetical protein
MSDFPGRLLAAAAALDQRTDIAHGPALAGLLRNRAEDMRRKIVLWGRTGKDVGALVERDYGIYLAVAQIIEVSLSVTRQQRKRSLREGGEHVDQLSG